MNNLEPLQAPSTAAEFFNLLYGQMSPEEHLAITSIRRKIPSTRFFNSLDDDALYDHIAARDQAGCDVYFGVGLLNSALPEGRGTKKDICVLPGLWLDVDFNGPGHKEKKYFETEDLAMDVIQSAVGCAPSVTVRSGGGLHLYFLFAELWRLTSEEKREKADRVSQGFQRAILREAKLRGAEIDSTGDITRILRVPGTSNKKQTPYRPVRVTAIADWRFQPEQLFRFENEPAIRSAERSKSKTHAAAPLNQQELDELVEGQLQAYLTNSPELKRAFDREDVGNKFKSNNSKIDQSLASKLAHAGASDAVIGHALVASRANVADGKCKHLRADYILRTVARALSSAQANGIKPAAGDEDRPAIVILPGRQPQILDEAEQVLVAHAPQQRCFQHAGEVVRVVTLDRQTGSRSLQRPLGAIQLMPVSALNLLETFNRLIAWKRPGKPQKDKKPADCPKVLAETYLARGEWRLPHLVGIIEAPIMRPDGTILLTHGYDEATRLYLCGKEDWSAIPSEPTPADAKGALAQLLEPFDEFPFVDNAARSVVIAGILTAIQRRLLKSAPMFGFDAPAQRNGKSLLAESIGLIALGRATAATSVADDAAELRKAITSALRENLGIIHLDNITHPLDSDALAIALTQEMYSDRLLGATRTLTLPTNVLWTASGNNLTFRGDLPSRVLISRIDAAVERPEERTFKIVDLPAYLVENRQRLVAAALTILRAFHVAGRPPQALRAWGGFDQWSREIREPLVWLGLADPCATREAVISADPEREMIADVLRTWYDTVGERAVRTSEAAEIANRADIDSEFKRALLAVAACPEAPRTVDVGRLGNWCRLRRDIIVDGFRLTPIGTHHRAKLWRVSLTSLTSLKTSNVSLN